MLGAELHDNMNQIPAAVKLYMESAPVDDTKRIALIEESHDLISLAMEEIRKLSKSLAPPTLGIMTLKDAIAEMIRTIQQVNDLDITTAWENMEETAISEPLQLTIFRIV